MGIPSTLGSLRNSEEADFALWMLHLVRRVSLLGSDAEVANLVRKSGWFLTKDLEKTMVPNIELLKSCFVRMEQIIRCMHSYPRFFLQKPEIIRKGADKAEEMGVKMGSKMFIHDVLIIGSMSNETWELKL
ncbi:hypothetical protein Pfo_021788 [Paulownia fortunei]|nr:hypothetical protein Pfo_021788 [Paulownia fortunei]